METEDRFVCLRTNVESANITEEKYEGKIRTQKYDSCVFQQDLTQCVCGDFKIKSMIIEIM